jgi:hypothetical protein
VPNLSVYIRKKTNGFAAIVLLTLLLGQTAGALGAKLVITPATIPDGQYGTLYKNQTLKAAGGKSPYTYSISAGSLPPGLSLSSSGVLSGTPTAAGKYSFTITVHDNSKTPITGTQDYTLDIDQVSLSITAANSTITYGGAIPTFTVSYSGFVNGDNASSLTTPPTITAAATSASPTGVYSITPSGAVDPNYSIAFNAGTLTINQATLTIVAKPQSKQYGAPDPTLTYTTSGLVNGDQLTGSLTRAPGEDVGTYAITMGTLSAGPNYKVSFTGNFLTITAASQEITWTQNLLVGCSTVTQIQLSATASSGLPVTYSVSDANVATVSGNVLTLVNPGTAVVTATQTGNADLGPAPAVTDTVVYQPASLISQHWSDVIFFDNSSGDYIGWQWYKNGDSIPGATQPYYSESPSLNGQFYVVATNKDGEQIQTCTLTISGDSVIPGSIKVYPNPAKAGTQATLTSNYSAAALQGAILELIDINGRVIQQQTNVQSAMPLTMPAQSGIYIIDLLLKGGQKASINVLVQ